MSRELKFRAWDKIEKKMWLPDAIRMIYEKNSFVNLCMKQDRTGNWVTFWEHEGLNDPIMQCTGLKDKNGVEIFENDIVKASLYESMEGHDSCVGEVWWDEYSGWMMIDKPIARYMRDDDDVFSIEVIGNIYEHSYLIDSK